MGLKTVTLAASVLLLSACATAPITMSRQAPDAPGDLFTCAMQQLAGMGYTVGDVDRDSGFIRAVKQTSGLGRNLFLGEKLSSAMTIAIFPSTVEGQSSMRVTVGQVVEDTWGWGQGTETMRKPSDDGEIEAFDLIQACTPDGEIVRSGEDV